MPNHTMTHLPLAEAAWPDHSRVCFHPGDDRLGNGGGNTTTKCFHVSSNGGSHPCFRPADDEPVAMGTGGSVSPCHHPSEDLAAGLHRTLTELEQQALATLSSRS